MSTKISILALAALAGGMALAKEIAPLAAGTELPKLTATDERGEAIDLNSFKDKSGLIIFFFPKAFTPGCTAESCGFSDGQAKFLHKGYQVFGASRDTPEQLKKFREEYKLSYPLLSDPEGALAKTLGVPPGARQTVIVGKDGRLERVIATVAARTHPQDLLKELEASE